VLVGRGVLVGSGVLVGKGVLVGSGVLVGVGVGVLVGVAVGVGVSVLVGVGGKVGSIFNGRGVGVESGSFKAPSKSVTRPRIPPSEVGVDRGVRVPEKVLKSRAKVGDGVGSADISDCSEDVLSEAALEAIPSDDTTDVVEVFTDSDALA